MSKNKRYFWGSFGITMSLILLLCGMCTVDYYTRKIGFGNNTPIACLTSVSPQKTELQICTLGIQKNMDVTKSLEILDTIQDGIEKAVIWIRETAGEITSN